MEHNGNVPQLPAPGQRFILLHAADDDVQVFVLQREAADVAQNGKDLIALLQQLAHQILPQKSPGTGDQYLLHGVPSCLTAQPP